MRLWIERACAVLSLFLVACSTTTSRVSPDNEIYESCFAPASPTSWNLRRLPPDLGDFYLDLASKAGVPIDHLLGNLAADYQARGYSLDEFHGVLRSLRRLLITTVPSEAYGADLRIPHVALLPGRLGDQPALLFLDPTCDVCQRTLELIVRIQQDCLNSSPPLEFVVIPGSDEHSIAAAAALRTIWHSDPAVYPQAVVEFLTLLPDSPTRLDELASLYLGKNYRQSEQFLADLGFLQGDRQREMTRNLHAPLLVYRGRIIARDTSNTKPFDPFRDHYVLALTFRLILLLDTEKGD